MAEFAGMCRVTSNDTETTAQRRQWRHRPPTASGRPVRRPGRTTPHSRRSRPEPEIGWHIRAAVTCSDSGSNYARNTRRSRPSGHWSGCHAAPGDEAASVADPFVARVADGFRFGFVEFPVGDSARSCLPTLSTASPTRVTFRLHPCPRAAQRILRGATTLQPGRTEKSEPTVLLLVN